MYVSRISEVHIQGAEQKSFMFTDSSCQTGYGDLAGNSGTVCVASAPLATSFIWRFRENLKNSFLKLQSQPRDERPLIETAAPINLTCPNLTQKYLSDPYLLFCPNFRANSSSKICKPWFVSPGLCTIFITFHFLIFHRDLRLQACNKVGVELGHIFVPAVLRKIVLVTGKTKK